MALNAAGANLLGVAEREVQYPGFSRTAWVGRPALSSSATTDEIVASVTRVGVTDANGAAILWATGRTG